MWATVSANVMNAEVVAKTMDVEVVMIGGIVAEVEMMVVRMPEMWFLVVIVIVQVVEVVVMKLSYCNLRYVVLYIYRSILIYRQLFSNRTN